MSEKLSAPNELTIDDLKRMYLDGYEADKRIFSEMRTNLSLVAGEHYLREGSRYWNRIRNSRQLNQSQKLKLTKNHLQVVTDEYCTQIMDVAPGVDFAPANEKELKDQKVAQMHKSYWGHVKEYCAFDRFQETAIKNFVEIGEVCAKVFWSMDGGQIIGYEPAYEMDEQGNMVMEMDEAGGYVASTNPVYGGKLKFELFEAYNLRRDKDSRSMDESPYLTYTKLLPRAKIASLYKEKEQQDKLLNSPNQFNYGVYDNNTRHYRIQNNQLALMETYFRPAPTIPMGFYYIWTDEGIVEKGELPYGIFPIIHEGFKEQTGNARSHSIIRHMRPPQIEINRCASAIAEHQVTVGSDKVWVQSNTKVSQGSMLPGVRVNTYSGQKPEFQQGRDGSQYFGYLEAQVNELYRLGQVPELNQEKDGRQNTDLYADLLKTARYRKKFFLPAQKFERFIKNCVKIGVKIAKNSMNEQEIIPIVGGGEYLNVAEFKSSEDINYQIKVVPRSDDVDSQFGKQVTLNHFLQYVGGQLDKEDIGKIVRLSPFLNDELIFEDLTDKYDNITNDILALDRGQWRAPRRFDDHKYIIKKLSARMSKADFEFLDPQIKQLYEQKLRAHEMLEIQAFRDMQRAQAGFIPSGGYLTTVDFYTTDPKDPTKTKRLKLPSEAIDWLVKALEKQGTKMEELQNMPVGVVSDMSRMLGVPSPASPVPGQALPIMSRG